MSGRSNHERIRGTIDEDTYIFLCMSLTRYSLCAERSLHLLLVGLQFTRSFLDCHFVDAISRLPAGTWDSRVLVTFPGPRFALSIRLGGWAVSLYVCAVWLFAPFCHSCCTFRGTSERQMQRLRCMQLMHRFLQLLTHTQQHLIFHPSQYTSTE